MQRTEDWICPLTDKAVSSLDCFDISMVVEHQAPEWTIEDDVKPDIIDDACRKKCLKCKYHPK